MHSKANSSYKTRTWHAVKLKRSFETVETTCALKLQLGLELARPFRCTFLNKGFGPLPVVLGADEKAEGIRGHVPVLFVRGKHAVTDKLQALHTAEVVAMGTNRQAQRQAGQSIHTHMPEAGRTMHGGP